MSKCECKECIHHSVCRVLCDIDETPKSNDFKCDFFKSKSLFVELKCELGQVVYAVVSSEKINEVRVRQIEVVPCDDKTYVHYRTGRCAWFYEEEIGKTVFLTKEEAEKKLKEMG